MKLENLKIAFLGTPNFAQKILERLLDEKLNISCVLTQPDRPVGRKKQLQSPPVKKLALKNNLKIKQFAKIDKNALAELKALNADIFIVVAYGIILPKEMLEIPKLGCINIHGSLLPKYRGASPIQTALLNGESETGITFMEMDEGMDTGDMLEKFSVSIATNDDFEKLEEKLITATNENIIPFLERYINDKILPQKQNNEKATYTKIIKKSDGKVNWNKSAKEIYNQFRAYKIWPQIFTFWENERIILKNIKPSNEIFDKPTGTVIQKNNQIFVTTENSSIEIISLQMAGKNEISATEFVKGKPSFVGSKLK